MKTDENERNEEKWRCNNKAEEDEQDEIERLEVRSEEDRVQTNGRGLVAGAVGQRRAVNWTILEIR